jgi:8-oxo-dGTP pyrophosphatase MutT (NUDIX family)
MVKETIRTQYAALPYRFADGRLEVLLITSRETRRWILPKGWEEKKIKPHDMAALEAYEEAGVRGKVKKRPLGTYLYEKRLDSGDTVTCKVHVFPLEVAEELTDWPEKAERTRMWTTPAQAAMLISEGGLVSILLNLGLPDPHV